MFLRLSNKILRPLGFQLDRLPESKPVLYPPTSAERSAINSILSDFAAQQDPSKKKLSSADKWKVYLNDIRLSFFEELLKVASNYSLDPGGKKIADFGSGTGYLLRLINRDAPDTELVGYDTFDEVRELSERICPEASYLADFDDDDQKFDIIFCTEVLEHLKFPADRVHKFIDRLNPGGQLVLKVPNGRTDTLIARNEREDGTGYWGHINFWSPESWQLFLEDAVNDVAKVETQLMPTGGNFALVTLNQ
ncbi:MAG: class I SAM-dependent methyltransferase [Planctomycetota bacterium]